MREEHDRRYFKWGLTALIVIFISILLVVIFTNLPGFFSLLGAIGKILSPLVCRPSPPADPQKAGHEGRKGR